MSSTLKSVRDGRNKDQRIKKIQKKPQRNMFVTEA